MLVYQFQLNCKTCFAPQSGSGLDKCVVPDKYPLSQSRRFPCSGKLVSTFPELRFPKTRISMGLHNNTIQTQLRHPYIVLCHFIKAGILYIQPAYSCDFLLTFCYRFYKLVTKLVSFCNKLSVCNYYICNTILILQINTSVLYKSIVTIFKFSGFSLQIANNILNIYKAQKIGISCR